MSNVIALHEYKKTTAPVLIVAGLPGAGKSTLVKKITNSSSTQRIAVLNDRNFTNRDSQCADCGMLHEIEEVISDLLAAAQTDRIIIEASPDCDVRALSETLINSNIALERIITVIDLFRFTEDLLNDELLRERLAAPDARMNDFDSDNDTAVVDLLTTHLEYTDMIVGTFDDQLRPIDREEAIDFILSLQSRAPIIIQGNNSIFDESDFFADTPLFNPKSTEEGCTWRRAYQHAPYIAGEDASDSIFEIAHGVTAYIYRRRTPFHPDRFYHAMNSHWPLEGLKRTFGQLWLALPGELAFAMSHTGPEALRFWPDGKWIVARSRDEKNERLATDADLRLSWHEKLGDRFTEIIMIGKDIDTNEIINILDSCLVTELELKRDWSRFINPFHHFVEPEGQPV